MTDTVSIEVEPWPAYPDCGGEPVWFVRVCTATAAVRLQWSQRLGRFAKGSSTMNIRRGNPTAYRSAVEFMRDFSSRIEAQGRDSEPGFMGQKNTQTGQAETGHSRARTGLTPHVPFVPGTHTGRDGTQAVGQDNPSPSGVGASRPTPPAAVSREEHKARLSADPRFAGWAAGAKA